MEEISSHCLLKFCPINSYSLSMIEQSELFFSAPANLNDPFEFKSFQTPNSVASTFTTGICSFSKSLHHIGLVDYGPLVVEFDDTVKNQLLWSHYASSHAGVCLVFDQLKLYDGLKDFSDMQDVMYCESNQELPKSQSVRHKSSWWEYERELRFVLKEGAFNNSNVKVVKNGFLVKYPLKSLMGIYFGCRTNEFDRHEFIRVLTQARKTQDLAGHSIQLLNLETSKERFQLLISRIEILNL